MYICAYSYIEPPPGRTYTCAYALCTILTYTCIFFFDFLIFFIFFLFCIFYFIFSDSRLAVVQPGYAVCCSHWLPLRMFPVIAAMKSWRAFWCIVSLSSTGISNPVCTMFNIINFLFFIFFLNPKSGPDY